MTKIVIVEDNKLNAKLFHDLLEINGYDMIFSIDGSDLLEIVEKEKPNIILMDIQLGKNSGIDLIKNLKSRSDTSDIPIIAVTAFATKDDEARINAAGCDVYLSKPISINAFFSAIKEYAS